MLVDIVKAVCGTVKFEASNGFCERLINLCAANNITLSDLTSTEEGIVASVASYDFKQVTDLAAKVNIDVVVLKKRGIWFKAVKYKGRWGIAIGALFFFVSIIISSGFIWEIEVMGNKKVSEAAIVLELGSLGLKVGTKISSLDLDILKQKALLQMPDLAWLTLNRHGSKIDVIVSERYSTPSIREETPCDIVASKTGQIKYMRVYAGTPVVQEGFPVKEGDLLISGKTTAIAEIAEGVHADAKIIAQIQFDKSISVNLASHSKKYTGKVKNRYFVGEGESKFPLFIATKLNGYYDIESNVKPMQIFSLRLPIMMTKHSYHFYDKIGENLTQDSAKQVLVDALASYENLELCDSAIISKNQTFKLDGYVLTLVTSYVVEQNIAKKSPIK